jgi:hypothetical protein
MADSSEGGATALALGGAPPHPKKKCAHIPSLDTESVEYVREVHMSDAALASEGLANAMFSKHVASRIP